MLVKWSKQRDNMMQGLTMLYCPEKKKTFLTITAIVIMCCAETLSCGLFIQRHRWCVLDQILLSHDHCLRGQGVHAQYELACALCHYCIFLRLTLLNITGLFFLSLFVIYILLIIMTLLLHQTLTCLVNVFSCLAPNHTYFRFTLSYFFHLPSYFTHSIIFVSLYHSTARHRPPPLVMICFCSVPLVSSYDVSAPHILQAYAVHK